ncbi:MAG: type II secretion system major pseudopilin GspG [Gammaproteobacteria bacterium]|nr:type II secretion system major pseudopilin GspG [Gammaproteobacteria bacterium]
MQQRGFTLIEIMVVVVIIGLLATLVVPRLLDQQEKALGVKARGDITNLGTALKLYKLDNFHYPSTEQGLQALRKRPDIEPEPRNWKQGGYIEILPTDPWGVPYEYRSPGEHGDFDLWTWGADGTPGGEGQNADLGNWNADES